jgi:DNA-binding NarL/FixJ family response regulator
LIVDDQPVVRAGLNAVISGQPDLVVCGQAADCTEALGLVRASRPNLIILAIALKGGSGLGLIKRIKARNPSVRCLVLSHHGEDLFAVRALRAGALGFVGKHEPTEKIIAAIRCVLEGNVYLSERMTERLLQGLVAGSAERSAVEAFTNRELQVFDLIRQGLDTSQIAAKLHVSCMMVGTYRCRIRRKLNAGRGGKLADHAAQWGVPFGEK